MEGSKEEKPFIMFEDVQRSIRAVSPEQQAMRDYIAGIATPEQIALVVAEQKSIDKELLRSRFEHPSARTASERFL